MPKRDLLVRLLDSTFDQENWYAPIKDGMEGITAEQAVWKPEGEATKSIWENLNHLIYYKERLVAKLEGREWTKNLDGDQTFHLTDPTGIDKEWQAVKERSVQVHHSLREALYTISENELDQMERGLLDILLHEAYHTGQILQLRKMQGSWPANR
ncbi:DinB family protein [Thalassobacillus hwangdonensis]|uniref:DinB family protein n=1 Tax=Thalassobacillus hwangdonensis TaxID=546108 RepID=A0ABW3L087_9BACI